MLADRFHFEQIRFSVVSNNDFIINGAASSEYMDGLKLTASYGSKELMCDVEQYKDKSLKVKYASSNEGIDSGYFMIIHIPDECFSKQDILNVYLCDTLTTDKLCIYSIKSAKLLSMRKELAHCIDSVSINDGVAAIKGWVVSKDAVDVVCTFNGNAIQSNISWHNRSDVVQTFMEIKEELPTPVGFVAKIDVSGKGKLDFRLVTKNKESKQLIHIAGKNSSTMVAKTNYVGKAMHTLKQYGLGTTIKKGMGVLLKHKTVKWEGYDKWIARHLPSERELLKQKQENFEITPCFSIVVPLYKTPKRFLEELVVSVKNQTYSNWQLVLCDGSGSDTNLTPILEAMTGSDERIIYETSDKPLGIADNTNKAIAMATGDYIVLGDHDDLFTANALYECVKAINSDKNIDMIYTDEDKVDMNSKHFFEPSLKPDFNIDLLRSNNYICHMLVIKRTLIQCVGMFDNDFDGAQDYDFIFRCSEKAKRIYHIPKILYHWRCHSGSTAANPESKLYAFEAGKRAVEAHYSRLGIKAKVSNGPSLGIYKTTYDIIGNPMVSIVIPNKDHTEDLDVCLKSIFSKTDYNNYEVIIIENNSTEEKTFEYYKTIQKDDRVKVVTWKDEFNYSAINNFGVKYASGDFILFLNNDVEVINEEWLRQMLGFCQRDEVGIVGARLYFKDDSIQHAGVIVGFGGIAGHAFVTLSEDDDLYMSRSKVAVDYSAVTAACMMTKKNLFLKVGGFDEAYKVAFNDVDYCMKIRELDKLVVYNPYAMLYHYESKSRGAEDTPEKVQRFNSEVDRFASKWPDILEKGDPYYNVNLTLDKADFSLRDNRKDK